MLREESPPLAEDGGRSGLLAGLSPGAPGHGASAEATPAPRSAGQSPHPPPIAPPSSLPPLSPAAQGDGGFEAHASDWPRGARAASAAGEAEAEAEAEFRPEDFGLGVDPAPLAPAAPASLPPAHVAGADAAAADAVECKAASAEADRSRGADAAAGSPRAPASPGAGAREGAVGVRLMLDADFDALLPDAAAREGLSESMRSDLGAALGVAPERVEANPPPIPPLVLIGHVASLTPY